MTNGAACQVPMMGDTPSGVVARRMWPSRVDRLRVVDTRPRGLHLYRAMRRTLLHSSRTPTVGSWMVLVGGGGGWRRWKFCSGSFSTKSSSLSWRRGRFPFHMVVEVPQLKFTDKVFAIPVVAHRSPWSWWCRNCEVPHNCYFVHSG